MTTPIHLIDYKFVGIQPSANGKDFLLFNDLLTKSSFTVSIEDLQWCKNFAHLLGVKIAEVRERFEEGKK